MESIITKVLTPEQIELANSFGRDYAHPKTLRRMRDAAAIIAGGRPSTEYLCELTRDFDEAEVTTFLKEVRHTQELLNEANTLPYCENPVVWFAKEVTWHRHRIAEVKAAKGIIKSRIQNTTKNLLKESNYGR